MSKITTSPEPVERTRQDALLERILLGAILGRHPQSETLLDLLGEDEFFHPDHKKIFAMLQALRASNQEINLINLYTEIEKLSDLESQNLLLFLGALREDARHADNLEGTARELRRMSLCRNALKILDTAKRAIDRDEDAIDEILDTTIGRISEAVRKYEEIDEHGVTYHAAAKQTIEELMQTEPRANIFTGITALDDMTGGFRPGELVILTAETGSGKTLLAQQTRIEACRRGFISLFCSGEMWARHLLRRELAAAAGVHPSLMRREDQLSEKNFQAIVEAASHQCKKCRILDGELEIGKIRRVARSLKSRDGLHLLILDYDELIDAPGKDENEQLRRLVRASKSMGMELNCAVILISQLRKEYGNSQEDKNLRPPNLSRLYGSGAKIKHASLIILAERKWEERLDGEEKDATLWVLKNRDGKTGPIKATFNIMKLRFEVHAVANAEGSFFDGTGMAQS